MRLDKHQDEGNQDHTRKLDTFPLVPTEPFKLVPGMFLVEKRVD